MKGLQSEESNLEGRAEEIIEIFKNALYDISKDIRKDVEKLYMIPNKSMYAAIYDLHDRLSEEGQTEVEWRYLYEDNISKIWPEEYNEKIMTREVSREWSELVQGIKECCSEDNFKIKFQER